MELRLNVGNGIGAGVPDGWHTRTRAANLVGRSPDTLKRWEQDGTFNPSGEMQAGQLLVSLYSDEDIIDMRQIIKTLRPGPQRKEA